MCFVLHAVDVMCPASQTCRAVLKGLLDNDWDAKVFDNLVQLLNPQPQAARPAAAAAVGPVYAVRHTHMRMRMRMCSLLYPSACNLVHFCMRRQQ